ncbi:uncharacterized protein LOC125076905 [Vanessa atalanta]|uniref:uncharacterized protein LOC125076905 n=1 Tax=Vanessa atalanta TaxID=42275 RepID=UPI001FCD4754|nr:uncharacterized protein LOC125076905 [Vanessa atalanta]
MKDEAGKVLCRDEEIKERWKIHFEKLMNEENDWNGILQEAQVNKGLVREISMDEIMTAVKSMKNGKALGPGDIPVEVWKVLKTEGYIWSRDNGRCFCTSPILREVQTCSQEPAHGVLDLEKAYDRVPREVLWWALKEKGLPGKYVELVRAMYRGSCTYVGSSASSVWL